jgi:hypothetical protein
MLSKLLVVFCALNVMTSANNNAIFNLQVPYSTLMSDDNDFVCAVPPGLLKTYQCPSLLKCANDCQRSSPCGGFNTRENGSCELYGKNQATFGLQHGCRYFAVSKVWTLVYWLDGYNLQAIKNVMKFIENVYSLSLGTFNFFWGTCLSIQIPDDTSHVPDSTGASQENEFRSLKQWAESNNWILNLFKTK